MQRSCLFALVLLLGACSGKSPSTETPTTGEPGAGEAGDAGGDAGAADGGGAAGGECRPTGCSGTVCSDQDVVTTCEYRPEYACYQSATCTRQADGACGWTQTPELEACLASPPAE